MKIKTEKNKILKHYYQSLLVGLDGKLVVVKVFRCFTEVNKKISIYFIASEFSIYYYLALVINSVIV